MRYILLIPVVLYVGTSLAANFNLFPEDFMQYTWFDDVAHVFIFGTLTLTALTIAHRRNTSVLFAISSVLLLAIADEFSQLILTHRSFSYQDLQMSLIGVLVAFGAYVVFQKWFLQ